MKFTTYNPATGERLKSYAADSFSKAEEKIKNSKKAFIDWAGLSVFERTVAIKKVSEELLKNKERYAKMISLEMGKPLKESIAEIEKCALLCDYYRENASDFLKDEIVKTEAARSYISFKPLGVILCIMPWNFPFWQVFRFAVPALIVGNTVVLKHSRSTIGCSLEIEEIFKKSLPRNVFQNVICGSDIAENLVSKVDGVSFTGSSQAGVKIASIAARNLKKFVLELGGSDPFIVLGDADMNLAVKGALAGRFLNTGQSCIAAKRFIVHRSRAKEFSDKVVEEVKKMKVGDPFNTASSIGPLANKSQLERLEKQVNVSVKKGAKVLAGGKRPHRRGFFYLPTVVSNVRKGMPLYDEEVFGPVLPIISAGSDEDAVRIANDTEYGLGASVWTSSLEKGEEIARRIQAGFVSVNQIVKSDPRLPFGGVKKSGIGRELGRYGMLEFCNIKTTAIFGASSGGKK
jgi:succinate-semialdehyde dehydrogenase / glutarate-semialdehyde dehydrogenase